MLDVCVSLATTYWSPLAALLVLEGWIAALVWLPLRTLGVVPQDLGLDAIGLVSIALLVGWAAEITRTDPRKE
jgi:hypothetical protein